jgi:glycosyltransferase involved in cell wall biosynthesis
MKSLSTPPRIRVAAHTPTHCNWGGSYQYAGAVVTALAGLPREAYEVRVWYEDAAWAPQLDRLQLSGFVASEFVIPARFLPKVRTLLRLREEGKLTAEQNNELMALLGRFSNFFRLVEWKPHIVVLPQMRHPLSIPGARQIGVIHDLMHRYEQGFPEAASPDEIRYRERLFTATLEQCDLVLVDSRVGAEQVLESYPQADRSRLRVLPFTAFEDILACSPQRPRMDIPPKFLFYPAQFWKHKNHAGLARAVARLRKNLPDIHVVAAGNTGQNGFDDFYAIVTACGLENAFSLPGYVSTEELAWLYRHARALVMPTFFGPTNIPPLEAMAFGCPVAVSGIYGMPEQCGDAALYFNPARVKELAETLGRLWTDDALCDDLRERGRRRAEQWSFADFYRSVQALVGELACGKTRDGHP